MEKPNYLWFRIMQKTNALLNLIIQQSDNDKVYLYVKNIFETKFELLINKRKNLGLKNCNIRETSILTRYG